MANKVKLCFVITILTFFIFPLKAGNIYSISNQKQIDIDSNTQIQLDSSITNEEGNVLSVEEETTATPTKDSKEKENPSIDIWQMVTFGLAIAFLAIVIGFVLGGKREKKEKTKYKHQKEEEENEEEESEE